MLYFLISFGDGTEDVMNVFPKCFYDHIFLLWCSSIVFSYPNLSKRFILFLLIRFVFVSWEEIHGDGTHFSLFLELFSFNSVFYIGCWKGKHRKGLKCHILIYFLSSILLYFILWEWGKYMKLINALHFFPLLHCPLWFLSADITQMVQSIYLYFSSLFPLLWSDKMENIMKILSSLSLCLFFLNNFAWADKRDDIRKVLNHTYFYLPFFSFASLFFFGKEIYNEGVNSFFVGKMQRRSSILHLYHILLVILSILVWWKGRDNEGS